MRDATRAAIAGAAALWAIGLALLFLYAVRDVLLLVFLAWLVAAGLRPGVERLERIVPRGLAVLLVYVVFIALVSLFAWLVVPPLVADLADFAERAPTTIDQIQRIASALQERLRAYGIQIDFAQQLAGIVGYAGQAAQAAIRVPFAAAQLLFGLVAVLALSFYWTVSRERAVEWLAGLIGRDPKTVERLVDGAEAQLGAYVRGLAVLAFSVGTAVLVGLLALGIPYAFLLAALAGLLELLPIIGPIISAIPAIVVAAFKSPLLALGTALLYLAVQQIENYVLVPKVQEKAVGLHPLVILLAVMLGGSLAGIAGAVIAVPVAALLALILTEVRAVRGRASLTEPPPGPSGPTA